MRFIVSSKLDRRSATGVGSALYEVSSLIEGGLIKAAIVGSDNPERIVIECNGDEVEELRPILGNLFSVEHIIEHDRMSDAV